MKKFTFFILFSLMAFAFSTTAQVIAVESFDYTAGAALEGSGAANDYWSGAWENIGNLSTNTAVIAAGSMVVNGVPTLGNKAKLDYTNNATQIRMIRKLKAPIASDGGTFWACFMMQSDNLDRLNNVANFSFINTTITQAAGQRVGFGRIYGGGKLGIVTPPGGAARLSTTDDAGLNWIVVKVETTGNTDPDKIWMWINPNPASEPVAELADIETTTPHLKAGIDAVMLKVEGQGADQQPIAVTFDELRLARTYTALVPVGTSVKEFEQDELGISLYPNPFNDVLNISYTVNEPSHIKITLFDATGRVVKVINEVNKNVGKHIATWNVAADNGGSLHSGLYMIKVSNGKTTTTKKLVRIK